MSCTLAAHPPAQPSAKPARRRAAPVTPNGPAVAALDAATLAAIDTATLARLAAQAAQELARRGALAACVDGRPYRARQAWLRFGATDIPTLVISVAAAIG